MQRMDEDYYFMTENAITKERAKHLSVAFDPQIMPQLHQNQIVHLCDMTISVTQYRQERKCHFIPQILQNYM